MVDQKKKALMVSTIIDFLSAFEISDIKILQNLGYEVHCACNCESRIDEIRVKRLKKTGITEHHIPFTRNPLSKTNFEAYKELKSLMMKEKFDLVHCHTPVGGVLGRMAAHSCHVPVIIYTAHGFHFFSGAPLKNWIVFYPIEKILSKCTDVLITINKEDYNRAKNHFKAKKTIYIPGVGVDTEKFAICRVDKAQKRRDLGVNQDDFLLLSVGELSERKSQDIVINSLAKMKREGTIGNIVYLVVGEGNKRDDFEKLIREYDLVSHIKLLGFRSDIDELCETVDCFINLSIREGVGIVHLEAMAAGLPLILADVNEMEGCTKNGVSGCCVDPTAIDEMVKAISRMYKDKSFRDYCGANNWKTVKIFDLSSTREIMEKIYGGGYRHLMSILIRQNKRKELGINLDDFVIISVGEINDNKNHQIIIKALAQIHNDKVKYLVVGKGKMTEKLTNMIKRYNLSKRVKMVGFRTDIKELLWGSDVFAFPSKREGLGVASIEAMSAGLPIIGHYIHGIKDYAVDMVTGRTCKRNDVKEYTAAIINVMDNQVEQHNYARNVENVSQKFSLSASHHIMYEVYSVLAENYLSWS